MSSLRQPNESPIHAGPVHATGSYIIGIDSDNDSTGQRFEVSRHAPSAPVNLLKVWESGDVEVFGPIKKAAGDVIIHAMSEIHPNGFKFISGASTVVAYIDGAGNADFSLGGVRTRQVSSAPGSNDGNDGDILVNTADSRLYAKINGVWKSFIPA